MRYVLQDREHVRRRTDRLLNAEQVSVHGVLRDGKRVSVTRMIPFFWEPGDAGDVNKAVHEMLAELRWFIKREARRCVTTK
jgi:hypothetical protein